MIATQGFDLRGEGCHNFSPLSIPVQIVDNTIVRLTDYLKGKLAQC